MAQQLFEQWFRIADADKDGAIGGGEAVSFFMRSGLSQLVLGQIWELASGGAPKLNHIQFSSAMRLVALAQARGGQLPLDQARAVIAGVGPTLPPPTLQGLDTSGAATGAAGGPLTPSAATVGGAPRPVGIPPFPGNTAAAPQYGAATGAVPSPYNAQLTGGGGAAAVAGLLRRPSGGGSGGGAAVGVIPAPAAVPVAAAPAAATAGGYPLVAAADLQRFQASFVQLDTDRDGFVTGAECFGFFSQSGLEKSVLRDIWSLVAGNESRLSGPQFLAFLYLMDCVKRGLPLPKYLPPGLAGFPPVAATPPSAPLPPPAPVTWSLQSQFGTSSNITAVLAAPQTAVLPAPPPPPPLPTKLDLAAMASERLAPAPQQHVSHVPAVPPSLLANVSAMDRTKLQEELQVCETKEKARQSAEERAAEARARQAQLTTTLQELVVFRNRTEVSLLTSQEQAKRLEEELEGMRKRYETAYSAAQAASEKSATVHSHIMELMGQKGELLEKMKRLEDEVAAAERMGPADVARLEGELGELTHRCAALEAARNAKMAKVDGLRRQQEVVRAKLGELEDADRDAAAEVEACQSSLESLQQELKEARSSGSAAALPALLSRAAAVYRGLYGTAQRMGTAVPFEALPASLEGLHVWADEVAAGIVNWPDDDVDARGFVIVNALPGADAPRPIIKAGAAAAAAAAAPPKPAVGAALAAIAPAPVQAAAARLLPSDFAAVAMNGSSGGFNDTPAFGDAPAFGLPASSSNAAPPPLAAAAAALAPPGAVAPSAPIDFGFDDAPAFGSPAVLPMVAGAAVAPLPPPAGLYTSSSFAIDPATAKAAETSFPSSYGRGPDDPTKMNRFGSAFSFGEEGEGQQPVDTPTVVSAPSASAAAVLSAPFGAAEADFGDDAFAATTPVPPHTAAAAAGVAELAVEAAAAAELHAPLAATSSLFGDDAFGPAAAQGFTDGAFAPAPSAASPVVATTFAADSRSSSIGGAPTALPPMDSGPLQENPFAWGAPPSLAAAVASATATTVTSSVVLPPPLTAAATATTDAAAGMGSTAVSAELFGVNPFGTAPSPAFSLPPVAPAAATRVTPPPAPPTAAGFEDDNPFGDSDNPFGSPAFR